ncbi:MAG: hypothetical protein ACT4QB_19460 [Gammaproteobacteria bacterium]
MEIVGIIVALITLGIALFALYWARKEDAVQPKEVAAVRGDEAEGVQYAGTDQDDVAGHEAAAKGDEATEVEHAAGSEERITPAAGSDADAGARGSGEPAPRRRRGSRARS